MSFKTSGKNLHALVGEKPRQELIRPIFCEVVQNLLLRILSILKMKRALFAVSVVYLCCNGQQENTPRSTPDSIYSESGSVYNKDTTGAHQTTGLYAIQLRDTIKLSLQQWDSTIDLRSYLGKPRKQKIRKLDENSDTFSGSFIKDIVYEGLELQLFSPPQNGKTFWVQEIILTSDKYKTPKGITMGDEWQKVKNAYPGLKKFPGENKNMYYVADEGYEKSIEMEFEKNRLTKLRMYYMMN
jgi:hypothetical protein